MNLMTEEQRFFGSSRYDALGYVIVIELVNRMIPLLTSGIRDMFLLLRVLLKLKSIKTNVNHRDPIGKG